MEFHFNRPKIVINQLRLINNSLKIDNENIKTTFTVAINVVSRPSRALKPIIFELYNENNLLNEIKDCLKHVQYSISDTSLVISHKIIFRYTC